MTRDEYEDRSASVAYQRYEEYISLCEKVIEKFFPKSVQEVNS